MEKNAKQVWGLLSKNVTKYLKVKNLDLRNLLYMVWDLLETMKFFIILSGDGGLGGFIMYRPVRCSSMVMGMIR